MNTLRERFIAKVLKTDTCWLWTGATTASGYGNIMVSSQGGKKTYRAAHRVSYELLVGQIPGKLSLDHLCRNRRCVNPQHLEPVTQRVNLLRGVGLTATNASKEHCLRGHEYTPNNTVVWIDKRGSITRKCRTCRRANERARYATRKAAQP
jgi:hypothetical protein